MGERHINQSLRIMVPNSDGVREPTTLPLLRRADQDPIFECSPTFLKCFRQLSISNKRDWVQHSLKHFRISERRPERVDPPRTNAYCFCPQTFQASSGIISWRARMDHVKIHQQHFGHRLATARHAAASTKGFH